jgi:hypothetical protein
MTMMFKAEDFFVVSLQLSLESCRSNDDIHYMSPSASFDLSALIRSHLNFALGLRETRNIDTTCGTHLQSILDPPRHVAVGL